MAGQKPVFNKDELEHLRRTLSQMSVTGLMDFYRAAHLRCQLRGNEAPAPRCIQELVTAWKQIRKWG